MEKFLTERNGIAFGPNEIAHGVHRAPSTTHEQLNQLYERGKIAKTSRGLYVGFTRRKELRRLKNLNEIYGDEVHEDSETAATG